MFFNHAADHWLNRGLVGLDKPATLIQIDPFQVKGEEGTGYEKPAGLGEFECGNCRYFRCARGRM